MPGSQGLSALVAVWCHRPRGMAHWLGMGRPRESGPCLGGPLIRKRGGQGDPKENCGAKIGIAEHAVRFATGAAPSNRGGACLSGAWLA
jgi:hypothetical protein